MFGLMPLTPAGTDYKSKKDVLEAWNQGKDFSTPGGPYTNKADFENVETLRVVKEVTIRYNRKMNIAVFKKGRDGQWK